MYESLINHVSYINTLYTDFKHEFMNEPQAVSEIEYCVVGTTFGLELLFVTIKKVYGMDVGSMKEVRTTSTMLSLSCDIQ